jgi:glycosyltransferase involved in cell wall biosynthesis
MLREGFFGSSRARVSLTSEPARIRRESWRILSGVTVIMPTIRIDAWLDYAVESILSSELAALELIVVHDGIEPDYLRPWTQDARVTVVHSPVRIGQAAGMNLGVSHARHEFIARLDADDAAHPSRLKLQLDYLESHPETVAVGSRVMRIDHEGEPLAELVYPTGNDIRRSLLLQNVVAHSSLMFRKNALERVGPYDAAMGQMEDYDFILRLAQIGPIANLDHVLTYYRVHSHQTSRGAPPRGRHITRVLAARTVLGRHLGVSAIERTTKNSAWVAVQYLRYYKFRKPGYERF